MGLKYVFSGNLGILLLVDHCFHASNQCTIGRGVLLQSEYRLGGLSGRHHRAGAGQVRPVIDR